MSTDVHNDDHQDSTGAQIGDVVFLFRLKNAEQSDAPPRLVKHAILAALRQSGLLESRNPAADRRDIAELNERGELAKPAVRVLGRTGWNA
jgi:hypothetical protein